MSVLPFIAFISMRIRMRWYFKRDAISVGGDHFQPAKPNNAAFSTWPCRKKEE